MLKYSFLFIFIVLNSEISFAQKDYNYADKYLIVDVDNLESNSIGYNFCKTRALKGKEIYVLNSRYKTKKNQLTWLRADADFMVTFYIIPNRNKLVLEEIKDISVIIKNQAKEFNNLSNNLLNVDYSDGFELSLILKFNSRYFKFVNCKVYGQAFNLIENSQYFPKYGAGSNRYELNFMARPYSRNEIDSLRTIIRKDSISYRSFAVNIEDFYDKWFINSFDRQNNTFDFWIQLKNLNTAMYSFGRITTSIKYKVNTGVIGFKMIPYVPIFTDDYIDDASSAVEFKFVEFLDLKKIIPLK